MTVMPVTHDPAARRYLLDTEAGPAFASYREQDGVRVVHHTEVPARLEGRGIGSDLVRGMLEDMRREDVSMRPACSFVRAFLLRHPEFADRVAA